MSHAATKWAFDQPELHRDMKPSEWAVLMVLADCHNPVNGCFPSQEHICSKTNLSDRAVRDQLVKLKARNLVNWDSAREDGRRGSNRYTLAFEDEFQPANLAGSQPEESAGSSTGKIEQEQPANFDRNNRQNLPPNPVREPVTEPSEREARAREEQKPPEPTEADRKRFTDGVALWPNLALDDSDRAFTAWWMLDEAKRIASLDRLADFVALHRAKKRDHLPALSTYFRQVRWEGLPPKADDGGGMSVPVPAYSEAWCMAFFETALSDRPNAASKARSMIAEAEFGKALWMRSGEMPQPSGWPKIARGDEAFMAWRKHLAEKSIWLKPESFGAWLWVPTEFPQSEREQAG